MSHPKIFFRESELDAVAEKYSNTKKTIDSEVENYFSNTYSIDGLYYKVGLLENKQDIYNSFKSSAYSIESFGKTSVKNNTELYIDPFSYSPFQSFNPTSSKGGFYIGIGLLIFFLFALIKKWRIKKFVGFLLLIAIGLNLYNYYVKEPEFLASKSFQINPSEYKNERMLKVASEKYVDFYQPKTTYATTKTYEYDVEGTDGNGDYVEGYVETSGKYGEGYILNEYGDKVEIEVEWIGNGEMTGTDDDNNEYNLKVKH
jgi:hypothetical protein